MRYLVSALFLLSLVSCVGTTGGDVVDFDATASGPADAGPGMQFTTDRGWHVELDKAVLHIGAVYLNEAVPVSGSQPTACVLPGTYVAEVTDGMDVEPALAGSATLPAAGHGYDAARARRRGVAHRRRHEPDPGRNADPRDSGNRDPGSVSIPFTGKITIGANRQPGNTSTSSHPICKERIVSPIPVRLSLTRHGTLRLIVDPRRFFTNVDFGQLQQFSSGYGFNDDSSDQPSRNLYLDLKAASAAYRFEWEAR